jgi:phosphopantothenoylcysteine decarboxylase/phosphopantothenate--cysteine ligase
MHPSEAIRGRRSELLRGRRIVVAVSGSIAAVEVPRIVRELVRHGADVHAVMTPDAARIVTPEALHFATGHPAITELSGGVEHVTLLGPGPGRADLLLIAPATANTIGKIAHGIDDTTVTSCASVALGGGVPILLAPAMHAHMGANPAVRENLEKLRSWGVGLIAPVSAEGEEKIASPEEVAAEVLHRLARGPWAGRRVLVIGGASREPIDDVRSVTNESSGETAVAIATQAYFRGAQVEAWMGAFRVPLPSFIPVRRWKSVADLLEMIRAPGALSSDLAAVWVPAALSDFTTSPVRGKIASRDRKELTLTLERAPKVLPAVRAALPRGARLVGFKLESGAAGPALLASARRLRKEAGLDWVVANDAANVGAPTGRFVLLGGSGTPLRLSGPKSEVAGRLLDRVAPAPQRRQTEGSSERAP